MKKLSLYFKLAFQNIKSHRKFYIPYLLAGTFTSMMCYILFYLIRDEKLNSNYDGSTLLILREFLTVGIVICIMFSVIIVFYTNSFLMKRRRKEIGLYNILGMGKRHLAWVQLIETASMAAISVISGFICGMIFSKLVLLLLCKMTHLEAPFGFRIDGFAMLVTAIIFAAIYFLALIYNLVQVGKAKPVDLLRSASVGQKPPKAKWLITAIGVLSLGGGYALALTTHSILVAIIMFLVAVILVIIGTYCLFTSGSITVLKIMQKSKRYYYKTSHFTGVSGMIYRMKANAIGLANICILSTMVLVTVSTTVALNVGTEDIINTHFASDIEMTVYSDSSDYSSRVMSRTNDAAELYASENKVKIDTKTVYRHIGIAAIVSNGNYVVSKENPSYQAVDDVGMAAFIPLSDYNKLTNKQIALKDNEVLAQEIYTTISPSFSLLDKQYSVKEKIDDSPLVYEYSGYLSNVSLFTVTDSEYWRISKAQKAIYGDSGSDAATTFLLDIDADESIEQAMFDALQNEFEDECVKIQAADDTAELSKYVSCRAYERRGLYALYGGFLFLGIFFGLLFTMATVLIIYYKQLSEGYDDKERFDIMQKVGLSKAEVRKTIRSQVLTVFFLPLVVAVIHLAVAFPMISLLLQALRLTNTWLYVICAGCTVAVFALIYAIVYAVTARSYYKIVSR